MGIGFRQDNNEKKDNTKKDVQPKAKELILSLLRENFSPEQTDKFSELQFLTTLQLAYKFEDMIDISKSSLSHWLLDEGYQTTTFEGNLAWVMYTRKTNT